MTTTTVSRDLLAGVLAPYRQHGTIYLRSAHVSCPGGERVHGIAELVSAVGEFAIPDSCYIDDTGHFNSVEFNICYNQLAYVLLAQCVVDDHIPELAMTLEEYQRRQLPDILIHELTCRFRRPIRPHRFHGRVSVSRARSRLGLVLINTHCRFWDDANGGSAGDVTLAVVNHEASRTQAHLRGAGS